MIKNIEVELKLTPQELAEEFCEMGDYEQAIFFESIYNHTKKWDSSFALQMQYVRNIIDRNSLCDALSIMKTIGDYAE